MPWNSGNLSKGEKIDRDRRTRAITLLDLWKRKIKSGLYSVENADWWVRTTDDGITLRIDVRVENLEDLLDS